jgi:2-amino-4-hydroxy-6-hydroxymethyldihydropteridine diphosphokinase
MNGQKVQGNKCTPLAKRALVAFGANLPAREMTPVEAVMAAMGRLSERVGGPIMRSRLWRTPAFPEGSGPDFVNAAAAFDWPGTAAELLGILHEIEAEFGRRRDTRWEARIMDLDLLALGDTVLPDAETFLRWQGLAAENAARRTPEQLILPHPRMAERGFVLAPLAEVAPDWRHPVLGSTVTAMRDALPAGALIGVIPLTAAP